MPSVSERGARGFSLAFYRAWWLVSNNEHHKKEKSLFVDCVRTDTLDSRVSHVLDLMARIKIHM